MEYMQTGGQLAASLFITVQWDVYGQPGNLNEPMRVCQLVPVVS